MSLRPIKVIHCRADGALRNMRDLSPRNGMELRLGQVARSAGFERTAERDL